ncbi:MAG: SDR family NAD(P)-dependent oxidoreductase [Saprospiraceae bacterium]|nr:SDR family NAD(P)-dependent oxidoreductase [Saprospiraceae bacterium]
MKKVLITGINSGIGYHLALLLADHGFRVIGTLRDFDKAPAEISQHPGIRVFEMHIDSDEDIENAYKPIREFIGRDGLFALINNAGMVEPGPLAYIPIDKFKYVFQINVFGPLKLIQLCLDSLLTHGKGSRIINMSSVSGLFASPFLGAYAGSKFALEGLSDSLRRELNLLGIHVIKLNPGSLKTGIWRKQLDMAQNTRRIYLSLTSGMPMKLFSKWNQNPSR